MSLAPGADSSDSSADFDYTDPVEESASLLPTYGIFFVALVAIILFVRKFARESDVPVMHEKSMV